MMGALPNANILIVDDSPANLLAYEGLLGRLGQPLFKANSGSEALRLAAENDFAVVVMDVMMPDLDGFDTTARLRNDRRSHDVPVIFVTAGSEDRAWTARAYDVGAIDMVYKPIDPAVLLGKVGALVGVYQRAEAARLAEAAIAREQAMRQAAEAANRQKDEFLLTLSHELRTPLTAIIGWAEMLRANKMDAEQSRQAIDTILRAARTQEQLVDDLLEVGRISAGKFSVARDLVDWSDVVKTTSMALTPTAAKRKIAVRVDVAERVLVYGDATRLAQVVWNLLSNGVKYAQPSGGFLEIVLRSAGTHVELVVSDDGIGIEPDFLPQVFERFRQADGSRSRLHSGLGLGLAIVRHIVTAHGGTVTAASEGLHRGARFTVRLPIAEARANETPRNTNRHATIPLEASPFTEMRILLVEDDADARELLSVILTGEGAFVTAVTSAREGLAELAASRYDLIISDIGLPGEDGLSFIRRVRTTSRLPAIALTGFAGRDEEAEVLAAGFSGYLSKPLHLDQLRALLVELKLARL
jgi:signal transduction histidine kinase